MKETKETKKQIGEQIEEIEEKIRRGKEHFQPLWDRYDEDFNLWQIKERKFDTHEGAINRTSNRARAYSDKCQGYLSRAKMDIRVKPPGSLPPPESIELSSRLEHMLRFSFYEADKRLLRLQKPDLKNALVWYANNRGRIAVRVLVYEKDGRVIWGYLPLDPRHLIFEMGGDDVSWFAYRTYRSPQSIKDNFGVDIEDKTKHTVEVWDCWDREINTVICYQASSTDKGANILKKPTRHNLSRPPISLVTAPTNPSVFDETGVSVKFDGESIYAPNRMQYKQTDELASLLATHVNALVKQPIIHFYDPNVMGEDGKPITIDKALFYAGAIVNLPMSHKLDNMPSKDIPRAFDLDYSNMMREQQMATFADVEYGIDQPAHSGTALSLLREDKNKVLLPRLQLIQFAYSDICQIVCQQLREQKIDVVTKIIAGDTYNIETITPEDLENARDFYMNVNFVLSYPYEDLQTLGLIEMATRLGIISIDTAREDIAQIPDAQAEKAKISIERASAHSPEIDLWEAIQALKKQGKDFAASILDQQLRMVSEQRKQAIQMAQAAPPPIGGMPQGGE